LNCQPERGFLIAEFRRFSLFLSSLEIDFKFFLFPCRNCGMGRGKTANFALILHYLNLSYIMEKKQNAYQFTGLIDSLIDAAY
jgi:hypothetical protein